MALVYSCCFWFSLRLGGVIIGFISLGIMILISGCVAQTHTDEIKVEIEKVNNGYDLIYLQKYLDSFLEDPKKFTSMIIGISCVYIVSCIMYIYGAFICNNLLMFTFIGFEFVRLILVSMMLATGLLLLKENTMDIGFLIGASVLVGFFLLGMFYLWLCAANLPVLINEMERDEQVATIAKLQHLLETNDRISRRDHRYGSHKTSTDYTKGVFVVQKFRGFDRDGYKNPVM